MQRAYVWKSPSSGKKYKIVVGKPERAKPRRDWGKAFRHIKIAEPAVKPDAATRAKIRKAVRKVFKNDASVGRRRS